MLKARYVATGNVSFEFRDFPIHAPDLAAILLGQCNGPKPFFPILDQMMADQDRVVQAWGELPPTAAAEFTGKSPNEQSLIWAEKLGYLRFMVQHGVPAAKARACLADTGAVDALERHLSDGARRFNVNETPFFVINGTHAAGVYDWPALEAAIRAAGG